MKRKTRRARGGELLGKGAHGITYNVGCNTTDKTVCSIISRLTMTEVILYDEHCKPHTFTDASDLHDFELYLDQAKAKIAKILINHEYVGETQIQHEFLNELRENINIKEIYGLESEKYTAIGPVANFKGIDIYGAIVKNSKSESRYILFGNKCSKKGNLSESELDKYIIDILESIVILQSKQYCHNDIKLDNTVLCDNKYKLIDWGASGQIDTIKMGTLLGTSPVKWYVYGYSKYIAETAISYRTHQRYWNFARSESFQYINERIIEQFTALLSETTDKHALNERFKYSYDIFMLGMTILHATHEYNIPFDKYSLLIRLFTSIRNPITSAELALTITKDLLKEKYSKNRK